MRDVVLVSGVRTAIGSYGGSLKDVPLSETSAAVVREAVRRAGVPVEAVEHVVFGNVIHSEPRDMYLSRVATLKAGLALTTPALTLNRLCGSGLQAVLTAAAYIQLGEHDCTVAGGGEAMSRAPFWLPSGRWGQRMGDGVMLDAMVGALTDPFDECHMGITAENVAQKYAVDRETQDALALESHRRATQAIEQGRFKEQIHPIDIKIRRREALFDTDEGPRADVAMEKLAGMRPVFKREDGTVTAGNASTLNDAAAAVVLMEREAARAKGLAPLARLVAGSVAAVEPQYMGMGPVPAIERLLANTGVAKQDIDIWEINEAFAAQALAVVKQLDLDPQRVNPNGSGISLGHPLGATGTILTIKALHELARTQGRYAVVSMCIGGGQGIAALFERE